METGTSNVLQVLQDLRMQQYQGKYQGNSEPRTHRPGTTATTTTTKQLKASKTPKSCETAARKQVRRICTLAICLQFGLLSGPCHLPNPVLTGPYQLQSLTQHTVLDDQPLEYINLTHTVN